MKALSESLAELAGRVKTFEDSATATLEAEAAPATTVGATS